MKTTRRIQDVGDLPKLASPARRVLEGAGYVRLAQLTTVRESDLMKLHGMGPNALERLRQALHAKGWSFLKAK